MIGFEEEAIWFFENHVNDVSWYYAKMECSKCGKQLWFDIDEDEYFRLRKIFIKKSDRKVPSFRFPEDAKKYGWSLDEVYERVIR
jgi:hypothetical protein